MIRSSSLWRALALSLLCTFVVGAQSATTVLRVRVTFEGHPVAGARVEAGAVADSTRGDGVATLRVAPGTHRVITTRLGFRPDTGSLEIRNGGSLEREVRLERLVADLAAVTVSATRSERRVEDTPLRVEIIDEEEIGEKVAMTPGDIAMMLNETAGLRVQVSSPALGSASVRVQGLNGRYAMLLSDGLPLYGGQGGGLGLLQIPPVDLGRVEVIKGAASALYGSTALGGVINLVSRRPGDRTDHTLVLNQTTRGGSDAVLFSSAPMSERWAGTALVGLHRQRQNDLDGDGWSDMAGFRRLTVRPRVFYDNAGGRSFFGTFGITVEERDGGTLPGRSLPSGGAFVEGLETRRFDVGVVARHQITSGNWKGAFGSLRASAMLQRHSHTFGGAGERDRHSTAFGEYALTVPRGRASYVAGVAVQREGYWARDVAGFDYAFVTPSFFAQADVDITERVALSTSARVDRHRSYGTLFHPRFSLLFRAPSQWSARASVGTGAFVPTPFTDETEVLGLRRVRPLAGLRVERAITGSVDVGGPVSVGVGVVDLNATVFASRVRDPLDLAPFDGTSLALVNGGTERVLGGEFLLRLTHPIGEAGSERVFRMTTTFTRMRSTSCDGSPCGRASTPLNPRVTAGLVASVESEGEYRAGLEMYYTGAQALEANPYRAESEPYLALGVLVERRFGRARLFLNAENLGDVRQTRWDPLPLPEAGADGRRTTDVWSLLEGRTFNLGIRWALGDAEPQERRAKGVGRRGW